MAPDLARTPGEGAQKGDTAISNYISPPRSLDGALSPRTSPVPSPPPTRKRLYRSPSSNESATFNCAHPKAEGQEKLWKRRATAVTQESCRRERDSERWLGRGRTPWSTPVIAVIDEIRQDSRRILKLEKQLKTQKEEMDNEMAVRQEELVSLAAASLATTKHGRGSITNLTQQTALDWRRQKHASPSRSTSPSRKLLRESRSAKPAVSIDSLEDEDIYIHKDIMDILSPMIRSFRQHVIPAELRGELQKSDPIGSLCIPESAFRYENYTSEQLTRKWEKAQKIRKGARLCAKHGKDENAWCTEVVQRMLRWQEKSTNLPFLELDNIQSQQIDPDFLPILTDNTFVAKRADYALAFSEQHPDVQHTYNKIWQTGPSAHLSQMSDDYTGKLAMLAGVEVKRDGGNGPEALAQLSMWLAAGITSLSRLRNCQKDHMPSQKRLPLMGWTVVGHRWETYIAYEKEPHHVQIFGPIGSISADTSSYYGVFKLMDMIEKMKEYGKQTYWPWLLEDVLPKGL